MHRRVEERNIITRGLTVKSFTLAAYLHLAAEFQQTITPWFAAGKIAYDETIVDDIDNTVDAFLDMIRGANTGKMLVKIAPEEVDTQDTDTPEQARQSASRSPGRRLPDNDARKQKTRGNPRVFSTCWGTWTRTKNNGTRNRRVANYTIPQGFWLVSHQGNTLPEMRPPTKPSGITRASRARSVARECASCRAAPSTQTAAAKCVVR